jgi:protein phosphatase
LILHAASLTSAGRRPTNEDALGSRIPEAEEDAARRGALFAIADGVGGHSIDGDSAGRTASQAAIATLFAEYYSPLAPGRIEDALRKAAEACNLNLMALARGARAGPPRLQTTLTAIAIAGAQAYIVHVGDSRAYLLRDCQLRQLTVDHTEAAELLNLRLITEEQARVHPRRGVLTRAVGARAILRPDFLRVALVAGDRFVVCSDGLWNPVEADTLCLLAQEHPASACEQLVQEASRSGGQDNISVHVVHVVRPGSERPAASGRIARLLAGLRGD